MNESAELERLISRFLDDECSADERRVLHRTLRDDPAAAALYEEYTALDREIGHAMRSALGRHTHLPVGRSLRPWPQRRAWSRWCGSRGRVRTPPPTVANKRAIPTQCSPETGTTATPRLPIR